MKTFYYFDMKSKILVNTMIVTAIFMTMIGVISYATSQEPSAQNMTKMGDLGKFGNKTSGQQEMINGTINLQQTIFEAVGSKVNTTLTQAITTAEQTIGNNSFALAAFGGPHGGYLVYTIILGTPSMEFHKVIVDPGTGQILASQAISHEEWMRMQQMQQMMHSGGGPGGGGMMMSEGGPMMKSDHGWK
jgi:uncharacterized membrane protein YdcZ (DUF606 family)